MTVAIVPAKELSQAKGRLSPILNEKERQRLAACMLQDVLMALLEAKTIDDVAVVSPDKEILSLAQKLSCEQIMDPPNKTGLNSALTHAIEITSTKKHNAVLIIPSDIPLISASDIDNLMQHLPVKRGTVLCSSQSGGTNAIGIKPPGIMPLHFGKDSFQEHTKEAKKKNLPLKIVSLPSLAEDIDGPPDLASLVSSPLWKENRAVATHNFLHSIIINSRMASVLGGSACLGSW